MEQLIDLIFGALDLPLDVDEWEERGDYEATRMALHDLFDEHRDVVLRALGEGCDFDHPHEGQPCGRRIIPNPSANTGKW